MTSKKILSPREIKYTGAMNFNKNELLKELILILEKNLQTLIESSRFAKEAATGEEAKAENKYDTRGLEASYLAGAQSKRTIELQEVIYRLQNLKVKTFREDDPIASSAIVKLKDENNKTKTVFLLPVAGGIDLTGRIQTLAVYAPLAQSLLDKVVGDSIELQIGEKTTFYEVTEIA